MKDERSESIQYRIKTFKNGLPWINVEYYAETEFYYSSFYKAIVCFSCDFFFDDLSNSADVKFLHIFLKPECKSIKPENYLWGPLDMSIKSNRLRTLKKWPVAMNKEAVADHFYYMGNGKDDTLECFRCDNSFGNWKNNDEPEKAHDYVDIKCNFRMPKSYVSEEDRRITFTHQGILVNVDRFVQSGLYCIENKMGSIELACFACHYHFFVSNIDHNIDELNNKHNPRCLYMNWKKKKLKPVNIKLRIDSDLLSLRDRLKSLEDWPIFFMDLMEVASSGFYYNGTGYDDILECVVCKLTLRNFRIGDDINDIHKRSSPNCHFSSSITYKPYHTFYSIFKNRLESFTDWPTILQKPFDMAEAGFVYSKRGDEVFCYCCNVMFTGWNSGEDLWVKHCIYHPKCAFLILTKGEEFVNKVIALASSEKSTHSNENPLNNEDHIEIDNVNLCKICMVDTIQTVFSPCGHSLACYKCAGSVSICPFCRGPFEEFIMFKYK